MLLYAVVGLLSTYGASGVVPVSPLNLAARDDFEEKRTMFKIVLGCVSTTILCAWTAVHPNVPPRSKWKARWSRLKLMFWMIVAPELVLAWAVRQFFAAREVRDIYNKIHYEQPEWKKWTLTHGHFFEMGGFILIDPGHKAREPKGRKGVVLTIDYLKENPDIDFPEITEDEIRDWSKGDMLFKLIAILQTSWFIIQCAARGVQGLALTELELITLALASLNAVTFAIWWNKPLGVQEPVKIYLEAEGHHFEHAGRPKFYKFRLSFGDVVRRGFSTIKGILALGFGMLATPCDDGVILYPLLLIVVLPIVSTYIVICPFFIIFMVFPLGIISLLKVIETEPVTQETLQSPGVLAVRILASLQNFRFRLSVAVERFVERWLEEIFDERGDFFVFVFGWFILLPLLFVFLCVFIILLTPFLTLLFLLSFIFTAVFGIVTTSVVRPGAPHVPSFYAPITPSDYWSRMVVFALFGVIFGGLHCIGWNFEFPTQSERMLWRATSLAITIIPPTVGPIDFFLAHYLRNDHILFCGRFERIVLLTLDLIMTILLFAYVPARMSLVVQALVLLRAPTASALVEVDWTKYVPHLFLV